MDKTDLVFILDHFLRMEIEASIIGTGKRISK